MKIFVTSDIHGNKVIMNKLDLVEDVDLIIICGDIGGKSGQGKTFEQFSQYQKSHADYLQGLLSVLPTPSRFILGNDDWFEYEGPNYLISKEVIGEINIIPFEYVLFTPFSTNREVNENKLRYELSKLTADSNSIIVAHTPPLGAGDILYSGRHCGSIAVREWIESAQPKMWLCGHIHEDNSTSFIGDTLIVNAACTYTDHILRGWKIDTETLDTEKIIF